MRAFDKIFLGNSYQQFGPNFDVVIRTQTTTKRERSMKVLFVLFGAIFIATLSSCITIDCEFKTDFIHDWGDRYSCRTIKFITKDGDKRINLVNGDHLKGRMNENVTQYFARGLNVERFPSGLGDYFVGLEVVRISVCNMRLLIKSDMEGLGRLKYLDLIGNKIEKLDSNAFDHAPKLIEVILNNNRLQFIGAQFLESLKNIQSISFGGNICVTSYSKHSSEQLARLKTEINLKCSDISLMDLISRFNLIESKMEILLKKFDQIANELSIGKKN